MKGLFWKQPSFFVDASGIYLYFVDAKWMNKERVYIYCDFLHLIWTKNQIYDNHIQTTVELTTRIIRFCPTSPLHLHDANTPLSGGDACRFHNSTPLFPGGGAVDLR